jgi:hypothetical protein
VCILPRDKHTIRFDGLGLIFDERALDMVQTVNQKRPRVYATTVFEQNELVVPICARWEHLTLSPVI